jgi:hypothetical protein
MGVRVKSTIDVTLSIKKVKKSKPVCLFNMWEWRNTRPGLRIAVLYTVHK